MSHPLNDTKTLRQFVRAGRAGAATKYLSMMNHTGSETAVEVELLALLQFERPSDIEARLKAIPIEGLATEPLARWFMACGICANRLRDPLASLAAFRHGIETAYTQDNPVLQGEIILERARVYSWMGSFARAHEDLAEALVLSSKAPHLKFSVLLRYADMYAEAERWSQAERFVVRALEEGGNLDGCIHSWQLLDCAIRVAQGQKKSAETYLSQLAKDVHQLPQYLMFRYSVSLTREAMQKNDLACAHANFIQVDQLAKATPEDSYERAVAAGLAGELLCIENEQKAALPLLTEASSWFEARDLAVPLLKLSLLQVEALMLMNEPNAAARLLSKLRDYCGRRGLQLQRETIDLAQQRHGLPRMAEIETGRVAKSNAWNTSRAYVILDQLGQGGQGTVFKAHDTARDRVVAFKKLTLDDEAFRILQNEVEALCRAQVPGVARVIACGTAEDGIAYITQELVEGQSLRMIQKDENTPSQLVRLAAILDHLHAKGLCHGDIKPDNVIITPEGTPVLVDFGAARNLFKVQTQSAATRAYLPHGFGARLLSPIARDQFAFGLMLLEMMTGTDPSHRVDWQNGASNKKMKSVSQLIDELNKPKKNKEFISQILLSRLSHVFQKPSPLAKRVHGLLS